MINLKPKRTRSREIGDLGEDIASLFLQNNGFEIVDRNYNRKWGEIDIIARKNLVWHFIEVKTVAHETDGSNQEEVSQITEGWLRPEENLHEAKLKKVSRTAETYMLERGLDEVDWQIDGLTVRLNIKDRKAKVMLMQNVL